MSESAAGKVAPPAFDPRRYPRTYRMALHVLLTRSLWMIAAGVFGIGACAASISPHSMPLLDRLLAAAIGIVLLISAVSWFRRLRRFHFTIYPDAIVLRDGRSIERMNRNDIAEIYFKCSKTQHGWRGPRQSLNFVSRQPKVPELALPLLFNTDAALDAWLAGLPVGDDR